VVAGFSLDGSQASAEEDEWQATFAGGEETPGTKNQRTATSLQIQRTSPLSGIREMDPRQSPGLLVRETYWGVYNAEIFSSTLRLLAP
jgi:hypothetical protein